MSGILTQEGLDNYKKIMVKILVRGGMDEEEAERRVEYMTTHSPYEEDEV